MYNTEFFESLGLSIIGISRKKRRSVKIRTRRFKAWYGCKPVYCSTLWRLLMESGWLGQRINVKPERLFYALHFLNNYDTEEVHAGCFDCDEKTFRNWCWFFVEGIASLDKKVVSRTSGIHYEPNMYIYPHLKNRFSGQTASGRM